MFSILMSVYSKEKPEHLSKALSSIAASSRIDTMDELLLVLDGPLPNALHEHIEEWRRPLKIRTLALNENAGLAIALNEGLKQIQSPWTMRFDTDDVFLPNRIAAQLPMMASGEYDLIGGQIEEFMGDDDAPHQSRLVPESHAEIVAYSVKRNPFNHMTVCFRTDLARNIGGYPSLPYMEDYALWVSMIRDGARTKNTTAVLVHARIGAGMYERRGGLEYAMCEYKLQHFLYRSGHKSAMQAVAHAALRSGVFLSPVKIRKWIYENALRG